MFHDRADAGRRLATVLAELDLARPVILALPRGGVPVGVPVAQALGAPLDLLGVHKIGAPANPEVAIGAVGEGGVIDLEPRWREALGDDECDRRVASAREVVAARLASYERDRRRVPLEGCTAVIVDDGLATGATAAAAVRVARAHGAERVVVAVPVGSVEAVRLLQEVADAVVCLEVPEYFLAVGMHFADFGQVSDDEVRECLRRANA